MDSGDYSPAPSFSSGGSRGIEPQYQAYHQPPVTVNPYSTEAPPMSSTGIRTSEPDQFPAGGQRALTDESHVQAPSYSDLQYGVGNSINGITGADDNRDQLPPTDYYGGEAPSHDAMVHGNNSSTGFNSNVVSDGYEQAPSYSGVDPRNHSNPGGYSDVTPTPAFDPQEQAGFSITGRNPQRASLL